MNRLSLPAKTTGAPCSTVIPLVEAGVVRGEEDCSLFTPVHYERNYAYPLLVWLHGDRETARQIQKILPFVSLRNYVAVAPPAIDNTRRNNAAWPDSAQFASADRVFHAIGVARRKFNVNPSRVFVAGCGSGGTMAIRIGLTHALHFAGAVSLGGGFPSGGTPLANLQAGRRLPLLVSYSRDSQCHPIEEVCDQLRLWHAAGLSVTLRQYPNGAAPSPQMLHDLNVWLMDVVTGKHVTDQQSQATAVE